ncbi:DUF2878 domain-containing protein [Shewanella colwelliana]|uniref:Membrane protein n=1 Tax=Shewanella colwelliana TaxID=23 RepID=A0ABQ4P869_SHECO|nr:DUF2878 domain-containing protein [Shewanella colwelliana]GIU43737.1 membrane protein [Shewanella colwelliana]
MKRFWIINLALFQAAWFAAAFATSMAVPIMVLILCIHFYLTPTPKLDAKLLLLMPIGVAVDKVLMELGLFYAGSEIFPLWLLLLWCMFVISLNHSLKWFASQPLLLIIAFGAVGGAGSYWAGIRLGVLQQALPAMTTIALLMIAWGGLFPLLTRCAQLLAQSNVRRV